MFDIDNPEKYVNDESIEIAWAIKAAEAASIHMNIIMSVDTKSLQLNKKQDEIYHRFREIFPDVDVFHIDEKILKNENKTRWQTFCAAFSEIEDFNCGTILRISADDIYSESNTILTIKINEKYKSIYTERYKKAHSEGNDKIL